MTDEPEDGDEPFHLPTVLQELVTAAQNADIDDVLDMAKSILNDEQYATLTPFLRRRMVDILIDTARERIALMKGPDEPT